jgi:hypothetical protein
MKREMILFYIYYATPTQSIKNWACLQPENVWHPHRAPSGKPFLET